MSYLTHRAERAVIAALLADTDPPLHLYGLTGEEFSSRLHREMFTAIADLTTTDPGLQHTDREVILAVRVDLPGADVADLINWRAEAPAPDAVASYAQLVRAGAVHRDVAAYAHSLAQKINTGQVDESDPELAAHERRLAAALNRHAEIFAPVSAATGPDIGHPTAALQVHIADAPSRTARAVLEDQVLADLLRDPEQIPAVARFLTDNAFTSAQRRHVYRTMSAMAHDGEPVDEVTIAWRVEVETAQCTLSGTDVNAPGSTPDESVYPVTDPDTEPTTVYIARLATTSQSITSAVHAGRDLLTAHLHDIVPDPRALAEAILAHRDDPTPHLDPHATVPARRTITTAQTAREVSPGDPRPAHSTASAPGPLPATGTAPPPGVASRPATSIRPGARP